MYDDSVPEISFWFSSGFVREALEMMLKLGFVFAAIWLIIGVSIQACIRNPNPTRIDPATARTIRGSSPACTHSYWNAPCSDSLIYCATKLTAADCEPAESLNCINCSSNVSTEACKLLHPLDSLDCVLETVNNGCGFVNVGEALCRWDPLLHPKCQCSGGAAGGTQRCPRRQASVSGPCEIVP